MRKRTLILSLSALLVVGLIVGYIALTAPKRRIDRFLTEVANVEIGATKLQDWREQLRAAGLQGASFSCEGENCTISEQAQIKALSTLRLAPLSGVAASVNFKEGIASEIYVWLEIDDHDIAGAMEPGTGATIRLSMQSQSCPQHYCTYVRERWGHPWGVVVMDSAASRKERTRAFAINTDCLTRIGGCKKIETILPQVFGKS
jgi:hypothetical protein